MNQDQFRHNVYEVLKRFQAGEFTISQAQRRIIRGARRTDFKALPECPICGSTEDCLHREWYEIPERLKRL